MITNDWDSTSNIVQLPGTSRDEVPLHIADVIPADRVLEGAMGNLDTVVIVGIDKDGDFYVAANEPSLAENSFLLQKAINRFVYYSEMEVVHVRNNEDED